MTADHASKRPQLPPAAVASGVQFSIETFNALSSTSCKQVPTRCNHMAPLAVRQCRVSTLRTPLKISFLGDSTGLLCEQKHAVHSQLCIEGSTSGLFHRLTSPNANHQPLTHQATVPHCQHDYGLATHAGSCRIIFSTGSPA